VSQEIFKQNMSVALYHINQQNARCILLVYIL